MEKCVGSRKRAKSTQQKEGETMPEAKPQNPHPFLPWACQPVSSGVSFAPSHIRTLSLAPSAPGHPRHLRPTQDAACQELLIRCQGLGGGAAHLSIRGLRAQRQPTSDKRPAGLPLACKHRRFSISMRQISRNPRPLFPASHVRMGRWVGVWRGSEEHHWMSGGGGVSPASKRQAGPRGG